MGSEMRRNLVIVRAGDTSLHEGWLAGSEPRNWDIIVSYFGKSADLYKKTDVKRIDSAGPKWPALHDLLLDNPEIFDSYDYIWLPDDDLKADKGSINRLFDRMSALKLEVAQPSLTWDSYFGHLTTLRNKKFDVRFTNYVEVMAPCISSSVLQHVVPLMNSNLSGWGLDFVWQRWVNNRKTGIGIIDSITVKHTRPVGGPNYQKLREGGISPWDELRTFCRKNGIDDAPVIHTQGAIMRNGRYLIADRHKLALNLNIMLGSLGAVWVTPEQKRMVRRFIGMAAKMILNIPDRVSERDWLSRHRLLSAFKRA